MDDYFSFNKEDPLYTEIIEFIAKNKKSINSVLDVGCSNGYLLNLISMKFPKIKLYGLDYDKKLLDQIKNKKITAKQGLIEKIPFDKDKFDLVIAKDIIEHTKDNMIAFAELKRVSKNFLFISAPAPFTDAAWGDFTHIRPYTKTTLSHAAKLFNMKIIKLSSIKRALPYRIIAKFWLQPIDDIVVYCFYKK